MDIKIKETGEIKELGVSYIGIDCTADFIGNTGALSDGSFVYDENGFYIADQETFDWWESVIGAYNDLEELFEEFEEEFGWEALEEVKRRTEFNELSEGPGAYWEEMEKYREKHC